MQVLAGAKVTTWSEAPPPTSYESLTTSTGTTGNVIKSLSGSINLENHEVIVLGAGIISVTSAYELAKAGHDVTVIDRQKGPALETSLANAGEVSFGYCSPWTAPGIPMKALKWLFMEHARWFCGRRSTPPCSAGGQDARELHVRTLRRRQEPHAAVGRLQPHLVCRPPKRDADRI